MTTDDATLAQEPTEPPPSDLEQLSAHAVLNPAAPDESPRARLAEAEARLESMARRAEAAEARASLLETEMTLWREQLAAVVLESRYEAARQVRAQGSKAPEPSSVALPIPRAHGGAEHQKPLFAAVRATPVTIRMVVHVGPLRDLARGVSVAVRPQARAIWIRNFDAEYYAAVNPDVAAAGFPGALHYLLIGFRERREPSLEFSGEIYLRTNPDAVGWNPLVHFALHGHREGRPFPAGVG